MVGPGMDFMDLLDFLLPSIPFILAWLGIMIVALVNWRRYPGPSLLVLLAALVNLLSHTVIALLGFFLLEDIGFGFNSIFTWIRSFLEVGGAVLMVAAVYTWRGSERDRRRDF